jgi:hypothetical protein
MASSTPQDQSTAAVGRSIFSPMTIIFPAFFVPWKMTVPDLYLYQVLAVE